MNIIARRTHQLDRRVLAHIRKYGPLDTSKPMSVSWHNAVNRLSKAGEIRYSQRDWGYVETHKTITYLGDRYTAAQFDAFVLMCAARVGRDGWEFREYEIARDMWRAPSWRQFQIVRESLKRLAQARAKRYGRRIMWYSDDGTDMFYMRRRTKGRK